MKAKTKGRTSTSLKKIQDKQGSKFCKFDVINLAIPDKINEDIDLNQVNTEFIPFGSDNLFPQYLAELKRQSSTHRSILAQKKTLSQGAGWKSENEGLLEYLNQVNPDEDFRQVYGNAVDDFYTFGNAFIQIVKFEGGINLYHIDATKCRVSKDQTKVYIHPNWANYMNSMNDMVILPLYPNFDGGYGVIQFKDYEPTFNFYGLPDYCASLEHIAIDYEIGKYNHTRFKNNFQPSAIVEINGDMGEKEAEQLVKSATEKWTGAGNNGKILFIVKNGDTSPAQVSLIQDNQEGSWIDLQKITDQNIITAHRWQPSLSGVISSGKMGSQGNEIRIAYEIVLNTIIKDTEQIILNKLKIVMSELAGLDVEDFEVIYEPPISFLSDIQISQVLTINEQRAILGYEEIEGGDGQIQAEEETEKEEETEEKEDNSDEEEIEVDVEENED